MTCWPRIHKRKTSQNRSRYLHNLCHFQNKSHRHTAIETIRTRANGTWLFVKVHTDQPGLYGIGSASDHYRCKVVETAIETITPLLIGRDASRIEDIWQSAYTSGYWRNDWVINTVQIGIDMALWDINGKEAGMPVYQLLGGPCRSAVMCWSISA